jgi:N4-gp56 family major capsid protein
MAATYSPASTTNPADFAFRRAVVFERMLLKTLMYQLRMEQFADKKTEKSKGCQFVRFFRTQKAARTAQNLTEGVTNLNNTVVDVGHLDCYLNQRGDDFSITDIADATDILDTLKIYMKNIGLNAALDYDYIIAASILGIANTNAAGIALGLGGAQTTLYGSNALYGLGFWERFAGVVNSGVSVNDWAQLNGLSAAQGKFTRLENLRAITQLKANDVMPPDGNSYPCVVAPQVVFDIRQDQTLVGAMQYRDNQLLYKWEKFELDGAAFIESTNPWTENAYAVNATTATQGQAATQGKIYANLYIGDDAFGTVLIDDKRPGGSPAAPKLTILDSADKSDPYNQRVVGAWKAYYGSILKLTSDPTDVPHVVASRVQTAFQ